MKKVMLVCGSGASSGFMAASIRKAAKAKGVEMEVFARSDAEVPEYIDKIDMILLGSHLKYMKKGMEATASPYHVPVAVIDAIDYGRLDGSAVLEKIMRILKEE